MSKYESMTIEKLDAELTRLHTEQKRILAEKKAVARVLDAKLSEQSALAKLAALSDSERAALRQVLMAKSVESESVVGAPGAG